ncbi:MAG TPA: prephenate dehydrogenase/arogenate dehydrogenase family protein [Actinomycetota bacterium]|nr:prephenate dehydrogenase/arogenate dehydrogenase family protein [Actinomycetota bacterium]
MTAARSYEPIGRVAVLGTGLMGTSVAMAAARVGAAVSGWDADPATTARAAGLGGFTPAISLEEAVLGVDLVVVCTPIPTIAPVVTAALAATTAAIVTDVGSIMAPVSRDVAAEVTVEDLPRYVPGHPMGGSERSGPEHASPSVLDGIVWVLSATEASDVAAVDALESWVEGLGARAVRMTGDRHDRLVAFVSHLPQVASTALMSLAATEEADEPEILLLAAGGFRDLTRLAASDAALWSSILVANRERIAEAIDLYVDRLQSLRDDVVGSKGKAVESRFAQAKDARLRLATKPQVKAGVAVLQVEVPDRPGALAELTSILAEGRVNIEDLQIVHSPEGGRGTVHLTVAADAAGHATEVLVAGGLDPIRLA